MPLARTIADSVGSAIVKLFAFDEDKTRVLDFACGSGRHLCTLIRLPWFLRYHLLVFALTLQVCSRGHWQYIALR